MKNLSLLALLFVVGCSHKNAFDVSADQVRNHRMVLGGPGGGPAIDLKHLPPGAVKTEKTYKKGDRLPDGRIADKDMKLVQVRIEKPDKGGAVSLSAKGQPGEEQQIELTTK